MGVNDPQYTTEELEEFRQQNKAGIEFEGKHYTLYEATQRQRSLERSIRKTKRKILIDEATGDAEKLQWDQIRLVRTREEYHRFSKAAGLPEQYERMEKAGFTWKHSKSAKVAVRATEEDVFKNKNMDLKKMSEKVETELDMHCNRPSKWSGRTIIKPRDAMKGTTGKKDWSCDIILREDAGVKTVIHEHLHGRSVSYYDSETYVRFQRAEEGAVELFAQEICKQNNVSFRKAYPEMVKRLRIINSITRIGDDYSFAKQLFDIPMTERYNWLKEKANAAIEGGSLSSKSIQVLQEAVEYMRGKGVV